MTNHTQLINKLHPDLRAEIEAHAILKEIPQGMEILREGQYIKVIPIVVEGLLKVYTGMRTKNYCSITSSRRRAASCHFQPA